MFLVISGSITMSVQLIIMCLHLAPRSTDSLVPSPCSIGLVHVVARSRLQRSNYGPGGTKVIRQFVFLFCFK